MLFPRRYRTWILEDHAQATVDAAISEHPRIEREMQGVEWVLIRTPQKGAQVAPDVYLYMNTKLRHGCSLITVLYTYTEDEVNVLRVWIR